MGRSGALTEFCESELFAVGVELADSFFGASEEVVDGFSFVCEED
jgi:hypothetical protein